MSLPAPGSVTEHEFQRLSKQKTDPVIAGIKPFRAVTASTTADSNDFLLLCDATSGAITVTLPKVARWTGVQLNIKKTDSSANAVTLDGDGSETIDGATTRAISTQYECLTIFSDGAEWHII